MNYNKWKIGFLIPVSIIVIGIILQTILGNFPIHIFKFPTNLIVITEIFIVILLIHFFLRKYQIIKYLSSGYAALSALSLFAFCVIAMVLIPQKHLNSEGSSLLGLNNFINSWFYALSILYLLITLGLVTIKRMFPINMRNFSFFLNHFGLWIILAFGNLGQADKTSIQITIPEGELIWYGYDKNNEYFEPDFAIELNKFIIDFYPPKLALIDNNGEIVNPKIFQPTELVKNRTISTPNSEILVVDIIENAIISKDTVLRVIGLPEKTYVAILEVSGEKVYIQNSTSFHPPVFTKLNDQYKLTILNPEPKYFGSDIMLYTKSGIQNQKHLIEVNKPLKIDSWTIYQTSYFKSPEYKSYISVFTAVYDPWLKIVYIGFIMMFIGAIYLIFGRRIKVNKIGK